jgi:hypothetical protein
MNREELLDVLKEAFDLDGGDPAARSTLDAALQTRAELDRLEAELAEAESLMVRSERGTLRAHPLLDQILRHRAALQRMLDSLFGPDDSPTTAKAKAAARVRWSR